jgi:hypothetical protein
LRESIYRCLWSIPVWLMGTVIGAIISAVIGFYLDKDKITSFLKGLINSDFLISGEIWIYGFCVISLCALLIYLLRPKNLAARQNEKSGAVVSKYNINQNHSGIGHNFVVDTLNIGQPRFELTETLLKEIASQLDVAKPVSIVWRDRGRGSQIKNAIKNYLLKNGFSVIGNITIDKATGFNPDKVISIFHDGFRCGPMLLAGGTQGVVIDLDADL